MDDAGIQPEPFADMVAHRRAVRDGRPASSTREADVLDELGRLDHSIYAAIADSSRDAISSCESCSTTVQIVHWFPPASVTFAAR